MTSFVAQGIDQSRFLFKAMFSSTSQSYRRDNTICIDQSSNPNRRRIAVLG